MVEEPAFKGGWWQVTAFVEHVVEEVFEGIVIARRCGVVIPHLFLREMHTNHGAKLVDLMRDVVRG